MKSVIIVDIIERIASKLSADAQESPLKENIKLAAMALASLSKQVE